MKISADTVMDATSEDCHHEGINEWGVLSGTLYHRSKMYPPSKWTLTKRISFTGKRILLIASLLAIKPPNGE